MVASPSKEKAMSFCPLCNKGQGNGGDPCAKCEAREQRTEALSLDAQKQFDQQHIGFHKCISCEVWSPCCPLVDELLCRDCFVREYIETELK